MDFEGRVRGTHRAAREKKRLASHVDFRSIEIINLGYMCVVAARLAAA